MRNWIKVMAFAILAQGLPCFSPYRCDAADIVISTATTSLVTLNSTDKLTVTGPSDGRFRKCRECQRGRGLDHQ